MRLVLWDYVCDHWTCKEFWWYRMSLDILNKSQQIYNLQWVSKILSRPYEKIFPQRINKEGGFIVFRPPLKNSLWAVSKVYCILISHFIVSGKKKNLVSILSGGKQQHYLYELRNIGHLDINLNIVLSINIRHFFSLCLYTGIRLKIFLILNPANKIAVRIVPSHTTQIVSIAMWISELILGHSID